MIEIFDPISLVELQRYRADSLERLAGPYGVVLKARWVNRILVTSSIEHLNAPLIGGAVVADYDALTLKMPPPTGYKDYEFYISRFASEIVERTHAKFPDFERVVDDRQSVHLLQPYRSRTACGKLASSYWKVCTSATLTCKGCIREALPHARRRADPLESVLLSDAEIAALEEKRAQIDATLAELRVINTACHAHLTARKA